MAKKVHIRDSWLRILCALAFLCAGLVHAAPALHAGSIPASELSDYVLPDGTTPILCLSHGGDSQAGPKAPGFAPGCDTCCLSTPVFLPAPVRTAGEPMPRVLAVLAPPRLEAVPRQIFPPNAPPRAPPAA